MLTIPDSHLDLFERPIVVTLVTLMADNQPQATPVWCSYDGRHIWVNTAKGRQKDINMRARAQVTVLALDHENPYRYAEIRGVVDEITEDGALEHINQLAHRYFGRDFYAKNPAQQERETRVIFKIKPLNIVAH